MIDSLRTTVQDQQLLCLPTSIPSILSRRDSASLTLPNFGAHPVVNVMAHPSSRWNRSLDGLYCDEHKGTTARPDASKWTLSPPHEFYPDYRTRGP